MKIRTLLATVAATALFASVPLITNAAPPTPGVISSTIIIHAADGAVEAHNTLARAYIIWKIIFGNLPPREKELDPHIFDGPATTQPTKQSVTAPPSVPKGQAANVEF